MSRKITDLEQHASPASADQVFIHDALTGKLKRITLAALFSHLGGGVGSGITLDFGVKVVGTSASLLVFDVPFADDNYAFFYVGIKDGDPVDVTIGTVAGGTKTAAQIQLTASIADTEVWWLAIGRPTT